MSRFISPCSLRDDGIMVGEMTVVSIMHKVRVCARHLCKLRSVNGWRRKINEKMLIWELRVQRVPSSRRFRKDSQEKPRQANQRKPDPYLLQTIFMSPYTHCLRREGQLIHKEKKKVKVKLCYIWKQKKFQPFSAQTLPAFSWRTFQHETAWMTF